MAPCMAPRPMSRHKVWRNWSTKDAPLMNCLANCALDMFAGSAAVGTWYFIGTTRSLPSLGVICGMHRWFHKRDLVKMLSSWPSALMSMKSGR